MDDLENLITINNNPTSDEIYNHLSYISKILETNSIKYWIAYGTLLGAIRQNDIIDYDYDFDLGILYDDYNKVLDLNNLVKDNGYIFEKGYGTVYSSKNKNDSFYKWRVSIKIKYKENPIGDLYIYNICKDNFLRRYDIEEKIYYYPNSTFPYLFIDTLSTTRIRDLILPCPSYPEILLEHFYGPIWRIPIKALSQDGQGHEDYDYYGSYKYTNLKFLVNYVKDNLGISLNTNFKIDEIRYIFPLEQLEWSYINESYNK